MELGWISRLISSQTQSSAQKANPQLSNNNKGLTNANTAATQQLPQQLAQQVAQQISQSLSNNPSFSPQELTQQLQNLRELLLQHLGSQVDAKTLDQWLGDFIQQGMSQQSLLQGDISNFTLKSNLEQVTQLSPELMTKLEDVILNLSKFAHPNIESSSIQGLDKEILGLLERSQFKELESLFLDKSTLDSTKVIQNQNTPLTSVNQSLKDNLSSELQSWHLFACKDSQIPAKLEEWLVKNQLTLKIPLKIQEPFVILSTPKGIELPPKLEATITNPAEFKTQLSNFIKSQFPTTTSKESLWTIFPSPNSNSLIVAPNSAATHISPENTLQLFQQQSPPSARSLEALSIIESTLKNNVQVANNLEQSQPIQTQTSEIPSKDANSLSQPVATTPINNLDVKNLDTAQTTTILGDTKSSLLNLFQKAIYQFESQLPPGESPTQNEKDFLLKTVLALKSQGITPTQIFNSLDHLMKEQNLLDWMRSPEKETAEFKRLPQEIQSRIHEQLSQVKLLKPEELLKTLDQAITTTPEHKDLPAVKRIIHMTQWTSLDQETQSNNNKQQNVYWSNGQELFQSRIHVQDERNQKNGEQSQEGPQRLVIYTETPALGEISAQLNRTNPNSEQLSIVVEDQGGRYDAQYQQEVEQLRQDLLSVGFQLQDFAYRARPEHKTFLTDSKFQVDDKSGIDLRA